MKMPGADDPADDDHRRVEGPERAARHGYGFFGFLRAPARAAGGPARPRRRRTARVEVEPDAGVAQDLAGVTAVAQLVDDDEALPPRAAALEGAGRLDVGSVTGEEGDLREALLHAGVGRNWRRGRPGRMLEGSSTSNIGGSPLTRRTTWFSLARNGYSAYATSTDAGVRNRVRYPCSPVRRANSTAAGDAPAVCICARKQAPIPGPAGSAGRVEARAKVRRRRPDRVGTDAAPERRRRPRPPAPTDARGEKRGGCAESHDVPEHDRRRDYTRRGSTVMIEPRCPATSSTSTCTPSTRSSTARTGSTDLIKRVAEARDDRGGRDRPREHVRRVRASSHEALENGREADPRRRGLHRARVDRCDREAKAASGRRRGDATTT